jgi:hypothetical protein
VLLTIALIFVAACGGDDGSAKAASTPNATKAGVTATAASGALANSSVVSGKCLDASKAMASAASSMSLAMMGGAGSLQQSVDQLNAFAATAPAEIRDDLATVSAGYAKVAKALTDAGYTAGQTLTPAALLAFQNASAELSNANFKAASDRLNTWFAKECQSK